MMVANCSKNNQVMVANCSKNNQVLEANCYKSKVMHSSCSKNMDNCRKNLVLLLNYNKSKVPVVEVEEGHNGYFSTVHVPVRNVHEEDRRMH